MCKWLLKCAFSGLWFLFSGSSTALPWQLPLQTSYTKEGWGWGWCTWEASGELSSGSLCPQAVILMLGCGRSAGPAPPTACLPHFIPQRVLFAGNGFRCWTVCLVCTFSLVASLYPAFCSTGGVMASLECLPILVLSFSLFFSNLFPSQASLFSPG